MLIQRKFAARPAAVVPFMIVDNPASFVYNRVLVPNGQPYEVVVRFF